MQRKFLEDLGLEKEAVDKIMGENGRDIETAKSTSSTDLQAKINELNTANETIKSLKAGAKKFENVDITAIQTQLATAQEEIKQAKIDAALQVALVADVELNNGLSRGTIKAIENSTNSGRACRTKGILQI